MQSSANQADYVTHVMVSKCRYMTFVLLNFAFNFEPNILHSLRWLKIWMDRIMLCLPNELWFFITQVQIWSSGASKIQRLHLNEKLLFEYLSTWIRENFLKYIKAIHVRKDVCKKQVIKFHNNQFNIWKKNSNPSQKSSRHLFTPTLFRQCLLFRVGVWNVDSSHSSVYLP